jgi:hypothetical protein
MIRFVLITVVFASQAFGHKGMLREKIALKEAHDRFEAYTLKQGCFFVDPAMEAKNGFIAETWTHFQEEGTEEASEAFRSLSGMVLWDTPLITQIPGILRQVANDPAHFENQLGQIGASRDTSRQITDFLAQAGRGTPLVTLINTLAGQLPNEMPEELRQIVSHIPRDLTMQEFLDMLQGHTSAGAFEPILAQMRAQIPMNMTPLDILRQGANPAGAGFGGPGAGSQDSPQTSPENSRPGTPVEGEFEFAGMSGFPVQNSTADFESVFCVPLEDEPGGGYQPNSQGANGAGGNIETQLEAWSRELVPTTFGGNAQDALKCAVKKVYADRRLAQLPEDGLYVDISAILQDPHLDLWRNCFENVVADRDLDGTLRRLFDGLQRQYTSPDMIVTTHYERTPGGGFQNRTDHCFALFRDFLMDSMAYRSARESIAKPLIYLLRKVSALQEDDALKVRFVDLVKDAMTACQDRVLTVVEELCSMAVSAALDDNQLNQEDSDRERAQLSVILSLQKRRLIQAMPSLYNEGEGIEYALSAVRLADRVFPMGNRVTDQNFFQGNYGRISPKELAEAICITDVNQLADLLLNNEIWDSLMTQKPSCSVLRERYCEIDPGDLGGADACALGDQIKEAKRRETIIALGTHGYLTADRNYPVLQIL